MGGVTGVVGDAEGVAGDVRDGWIAPMEDGTMHGDARADGGVEGGAEGGVGGSEGELEAGLGGAERGLGGVVEVVVSKAARASMVCVRERALNRKGVVRYGGKENRQKTEKNRTQKKTENRKNNVLKFGQHAAIVVQSSCTSQSNTPPSSTYAYATHTNNSNPSRSPTASCSTFLPSSPKLLYDAFNRFNTPLTVT